MGEVFERMEQYRPDEIGVFTKCLLPYHWTYVSSGEYQYAKIWGVLEEYGVKVKILTQGQNIRKPFSLISFSCWMNLRIICTRKCAGLSLEI